MPFEILDGALVLFGLLSCCEGAEVLASPSLWILVSRINPKLTCLQLANHLLSSCYCTTGAVPRMPWFDPRLPGSHRRNLASSILEAQKEPPQHEAALHYRR